MFNISDDVVTETFKKGDILECIDDRPNGLGFYVSLRKGEKYTVEKLDGSFIFLIGIHGGWKPERFKKCTI